MSKAEGTLSARAGGLNRQSRRAVLLGASGIAAVGALAALPSPAMSAGLQFSAEFLEYRRCVQRHINACDVEEPDFGTPELEAWDAVCAEAIKARHQARLVIQNRPIRSRQDFVELALVVREELWQQGPDGSWDKHSLCDELEEALQVATWWLIDGGVHV